MRVTDGAALHELRCEDHLPNTTLFRGCLTLGGLGEREDAVDGEAKFAVTDGLCIVQHGLGVRVRTHGMHGDGGVESGVRGWAGESAECAAGFDVGDELVGERAADGVGDGIDGSEAGECLVITDVDRCYCAKGDGLVDLREAHPGDDSDAGFDGGEESDMADAAESSGEQDGLASLSIDCFMNELVGGGDRGGEGSGDGEVEAIGDFDELGRFDCGELSVAVVGAAEDAVACGETGDVFA